MRALLPAPRTRLGHGLERANQRLKCSDEKGGLSVLSGSIPAASEIT
jgi:hypothetical protein